MITAVKLTLFMMLDPCLINGLLLTVNPENDFAEAADQ